MMNQDEIKQAEALLSKLEPGYLPELLFHQFTRLSVTGILELVPLRKSSFGNIEVLIRRREEDDPHWPNMLHTPGTVLRPTDSDDYSNALDRVFMEIDRNSFNYSISQIYTIFRSVNRGKELAVVFATEITDTKETDIWIPLEDIDSKIVDTQVEFVKKAAEVFKLKKTSMT